MRRRYRRIRIPMYYYREEREGSLSNRYRKNMFQIQQQLFEALKLFLEDMHVWNEENAGIYYSLYWDRLYMTARDSKKCHDKEFSAIRKSGYGIRYGMAAGSISAAAGKER